MRVSALSSGSTTRWCTSVEAVKKSQFVALLKSMWYLGIKEKGRTYYWRLVTSTLVRRPRSFPLAITLAVYGYHYRKLLDGYGADGRRVGAQA